MDKSLVYLFICKYCLVIRYVHITVDEVIRVKWNNICQRYSHVTFKKEEVEHKYK